ncbi:MAG: GGDEF domain-containing protein [Oscillospiraceae bacterium]
MDKENESSIIIEIQSEYKKIENKWLRLHYLTFIGLVIFGFLVECILGVKLYVMGCVEISLTRYVVKYILSPLVFNSCLIFTGILAIHSSFFQQKIKVYFISLLFVGVCFVFFSVHSIFASLYLIFTAPILLTVVYSDYILTTVTAFVSIAAKTIAELFVVWDPDKINPLQSDLGLTDFVISICIMCAFYAVCIIVIRFEKQKNVASIQKEIERHQMQQRLITDELTDVSNRTALHNAFQNIVGDSSGNTYIFVMIDLDNFKTLNDTLGHDKGDQCLKEFGSILRKYRTDNSVPFRFGGDEFCILFKNTTLENVIEICKNIQNDLKNSAASNACVSLTASVGIARYTSKMSAAQLLQNTDSALYRSKATKSSICVYSDFD